jgi:hypothetical protein
MIMAALTQIPPGDDRASLVRPLAIVVGAHVAFVLVMGVVIPSVLSGSVSVLGGLFG